ncbi:MAG: DsrE family protein [Haloarculaceae archaeon]
MDTVLHLTSDAEHHCGHALQSARLLREHDEPVHDAVVLLAHRTGARLVTTDSPTASDLADLVEDGVGIVVGRSCLDALGLPGETVPGVEVVSSGVSELVRLQFEGYDYVKIS